MANNAFLYIGAILVIIWGIIYFAETGRVLRNFVLLSADNRRSIILERVAVGSALCFIGVLMFYVTYMCCAGSEFGSTIIWIAEGCLVTLHFLESLASTKTTGIWTRINLGIRSAAIIFIVIGLNL